MTGAIGDATRRILRLITDRWTEASAAESDAGERSAFTAAITALSRAETHEDLRRAADQCVGYPTWARRTVLDLADAERDGRRVEVFERDGAIRWEIQATTENDFACEYEPDEDEQLWARLDEVVEVLGIDNLCKHLPAALARYARGLIARDEAEAKAYEEQTEEQHRQEHELALAQLRGEIPPPVPVEPDPEEQELQKGLTDRLFSPAICTLLHRARIKPYVKLLRRRSDDDARKTLINRLIAGGPLVDEGATFVEREKAVKSTAAMMGARLHLVVGSRYAMWWQVRYLALPSLMAMIRPGENFYTYWDAVNATAERAYIFGVAKYLERTKEQAAEHERLRGILGVAPAIPPLPMTEAQLQAERERIRAILDGRTE